MSSAGLPSPDLPKKRFTVDEYHRLIQAGILTEDDNVELLEGWIFQKMANDPPHDGTIQILDEVIGKRLPLDWDFRIKSGFTTADSEPEPDFVIVRGHERTYSTRHPGPQDVGLLIEVANASLDQDLGVKARLYARAGIVIYWIINLVDRQVEVYTDPTGPVAAPQYRQRQVYTGMDAVPLVLNGQAVAQIPVQDLLP